MRKTFEFKTEKGTDVRVFIERLSGSTTRNVRVNEVWLHWFCVGTVKGVDGLRTEKGFIPTPKDVLCKIEEFFAEDSIDHIMDI